MERGEPTAWLYTVAFNDHRKRWRKLLGERRAVETVAARSREDDRARTTDPSARAMGSRSPAS